MAWVWYARALWAGGAIREPGIGAMRHLDHVLPRLGCPLCAKARPVRRGTGFDQHSSPF